VYRKLRFGRIGDVTRRQQVKAHCWNNKQVHGGDVRCVVTQEGVPPVGWRAAPL
jgi:hypothetical protein